MRFNYIKTKSNQIFTIKKNSNSTWKKNCNFLESQLLFSARKRLLIRNKLSRKRKNIRRRLFCRLDSESFHWQKVEINWYTIFSVSGSSWRNFRPTWRKRGRSEEEKEEGKKEREKKQSVWPNGKAVIGYLFHEIA